MSTDDNTVNKIIEYFQNKDYDISLKLIAEYGLYTPIDSYGNSFAHYCAANNFPEAFALASKGDKGLNAPGIEGLTPLMLAADYENLEVLQILLDLDADVNKTDEDGFGAIYYAAAGHSFGRTHEPQPLVESCFHQRGRDWRESSSKITDDGQTYQDKKIDGFKNRDNEQTQLNMVSLLLERGACEHIGSRVSIPSQDKRPKSELSATIITGNDECAKKLVEAGWDINACDGTGTPPLCAAARSNDYSMVKYLLDADAKTDIADIVDQTPLALALYRERMDIASLLLEHTKDLSNDKLCLVRALRVDFAGYALLGGVGFAPLPLSECPIGIIQEMVRKGADIEQRDDEGSTPLIWAAADDNYPAVKALIELGADVNAKDDRGFNVIDNVLQTTQNWELTYPRVEIIKLLVDAGAEINVFTGGLGTPLNQALCQGDIDLVRYLTIHGASLNGKFTQTFLEGKRAEPLEAYASWCIINNLPEALKEIIPLLADGPNAFIEKDPDYGPSDADGTSLLYIAVLAQNAKCVDILIEAGADVNLCNKTNTESEFAGYSPLLGAIGNNDMGLAIHLINCGADYFAVTPSGMSAADASLAIAPLNSDMALILCFAAIQQENQKVAVTSQTKRPKNQNKVLESSTTAESSSATPKPAVKPSIPKTAGASAKQEATTATKQNDVKEENGKEPFWTVDTVTCLAMFLGLLVLVVYVLVFVPISVESSHPSAPNLEFPNQYIKLKPKNGKLTKTTSVDFLTETDSNCTVTYSITDKDSRAGNKIKLAPDKTYYIVEKGLKKGTYTFVVEATSTSSYTKKSASKTAQIEVIIK